MDDADSICDFDPVVVVTSPAAAEANAAVALADPVVSESASSTPMFTPNAMLFTRDTGFVELLIPLPIPLPMPPPAAPAERNRPRLGDACATPAIVDADGTQPGGVRSSSPAPIQPSWTTRTPPCLDEPTLLLVLLRARSFWSALSDDEPGPVPLRDLLRAVAARGTSCRGRWYPPSMLLPRYGAWPAVGAADRGRGAACVTALRRFFWPKADDDGSPKTDGLTCCSKLIRSSSVRGVGTSVRLCCFLTHSTQLPLLPLLLFVVVVVVVVVLAESALETVPAALLREPRATAPRTQVGRAGVPREGSDSRSTLSIDPVLPWSSA